MTQPTGKRLYEIDFLKGLACYLMLFGHALRARSVGLDELAFVHKIILYVMDFSGPMFFIASGMNVCIFWDRSRKKEGFAVTKFYLAQAVVLFVLGYTYNLSIASLFIFHGAPDIFQGVAVCTAFVFLITRFRSNAIVYLVVAVAMYAIYLPVRMKIDPTGETLKAMPFLQRQLFAHFSIFPWVVFFLIGAAIHRTQGKWEWAMAALLGGMVIASVFLPQAYFGDIYQLVFRGVPSYVMQTGGVAGLLFLLMRHVYKGGGKSKILRALEFAGVESFMFLILHYFLIVLSFPFPFGKEITPLHMYIRGVAIIVGTALLMPRFVRWRDRVSQQDGFVKKAFWMLGIFFALSLVISAAGPAGFFIGRLLAFVSAFSFAFVFGPVRQRLREKYTKIDARQT